MSHAMAPPDYAAIAGMIKGLEDAWNSGDASRFVSAFAEDADFVNVFGMYVGGRRAIFEGHQMIFRTIYAGSVNSLTLKDAHMLSGDIALAHIAAHLKVPQGPMAGEHRALATAILIRESGAWTISAFQNTFVTKPPFLDGGPRP